ncbi:hypothetical protein PGTUg99_011802 [Puccinia graminis f. sp. tritici]|uniref:Uncharacterized protein n=1 Tax=Puccinia graminis f. sp. tritici TaxID=56615 RepID=A0A5B0RJL2_PUCGR|nr:hypothetical protein PGTUg99_011802 [Puccinia graminis f. sp. tritici]
MYLKVQETRCSDHLQRAAEADLQLPQSLLSHLRSFAPSRKIAIGKAFKLTGHPFWLDAPTNPALSTTLDRYFGALNSRDLVMLVSTPLASQVRSTRFQPSDHGLIYVPRCASFSQARGGVTSGGNKATRFLNMQADGLRMANG